MAGWGHPHQSQCVCFYFYLMLCSSPAKWGTLTQATVSHPTDQLRVALTQATVSHPTTKLRGALTQATLSHQAKVHTQTQAAAVQVRGHSYPGYSEGRHSDPGYSVPPNSPAKGDTLTQATVSHPTTELMGALLSHQAKVYMLTQS